MRQICIELLNGDNLYFDLYEDIAPITVANFLQLVKKHYYDGTIFHRVIKGFVSQAGGFEFDPKSNEIKKCAEYWTIPGEFTENGLTNRLSHCEGVLSMARTQDPNSAFAQFFICAENAKSLDGKYAAFGAADNMSTVQLLRKLNSYETTKLTDEISEIPNTNMANITIKTIRIVY